jgi:hypothetical protein
MTDRPDQALAWAADRCRDLAEDLTRQVARLLAMLKVLSDDPSFVMAALTQLQRACQGIDEAMTLVVAREIEQKYPDLFKRPPEGKATP